MANRGVKSVLKPKKGPKGNTKPPPKTRKGRSEAVDDAGHTEDSGTTPKKRKTLGMSASTTTTRTTQPRLAKSKSPLASKPVRGKAKKGSKKGSVNKRKVEMDTSVLANELVESEVEDNELEIESASAKKNKNKLTKVIAENRFEEKSVMQMTGQHVEETDLDKGLAGWVDTDDVLSEGGGRNLGDSYQETMEGNTSYHKDNRYDESVSDENDHGEMEDEEEEDEGPHLQMVDQSVPLIDYSKSHDAWWIEDPTREGTLCDMWAEEPDLYVLNAPGHRDSSRKDQIMRKFASVIRVPRKYMHSIFI